MSVTSTQTPTGTLHIAISGHFDFKTHREFLDAYAKAAGPIRACVVDLTHADYLDSSALGMLLLLREAAGGDRADIRLRHCRSDVKKILTIANFHKLFTLED